MSANIDTHGTKSILMIVANPSTSPTTGWPIGFWWAELTHPYWAFKEVGYEVDIVFDLVRPYPDVLDFLGQVVHPLFQLGDRIEGFLGFGVKIEAGIDIFLGG